MVQPSPGYCRQLRQIKTSIEQAEASFAQSQNVRGELDLLLAEAELKKLRQHRLSRWNRQVLALAAAAGLALAGLGGWYCAKGQYTEPAPVATAPVATAPSAPVVQQEQAPATAIVKEEEKASTKEGLAISRERMRQLVRSARAELSNSQ